MGVGDEADEFVAGGSEGNRVSVHCAYSLQVEVEGVNNFCPDFSVSEDRKKIFAIPFDFIVDLGDLRTRQSRVSETN